MTDLGTINWVAGVISLVATAIALAIAVPGIRSMLSVIRAGKPAHGRTDNPGARIKNMLVETVGHTRMLQWTWIGVMHWLVFAGFIFLSSAVLQGYFQVWNPHFVLPIIGHWFLFNWVTDALVWLTVIGIAFLIVVRQVRHPRSEGRKSRFFGSTFWQAYFVEAIILGEGLAGVFIRAAESQFEGAEPVNFPLTMWLGNLIFSGLSVTALETVIVLLALSKILMAMVWLGIIGRFITMGVAWHRFTAWFNIYFKRESDGSTALGALVPLYIDGAPLDLEKMEEYDEDVFETLGVGKVEDFTWKGILDFTTCTECGRCQSQCPAWNTEKPLSPKLLMMGLREHAYSKIPLLDKDAETLTEEERRELERPLIGTDDLFGVIDPDVLWACTNCGACVQQCPVDIEHVDHIDDMRRYQVLVESNFPSELNNIFKGLERKGNPWGMNPRDRMKWTDGLDFEVKQVGNDIETLEEVEWLFWVGCAGAYEDRAIKTTQAVAELFNIAGVDFAVLGDGETCTGDPARRAGNEIVFKQLAMENTATLQEVKAKKVVSTCAHCFNTLKNEYIEMGIELEVVHHTQLLNRLVREGRLTPAPPPPGEESKKVTYHDPCFLGRHNQVYSPPRELIGAVPGAVYEEMPRAKEKSFCCGAGGARMWMEETIGSRINVNRTEEAIATGAQQIAVGCPFCRVMLADGLTEKQAGDESLLNIEVLDVAQLLLQAVKRGQVAAAETAAEVVAEAESITEESATTVEPTAETVAAEPAAEPPAEAAPEEPAAEAPAEVAVDQPTTEPAPVADASETSAEAPAEEVSAEEVVEELDEPNTPDETTAADAAVAEAHNVPVDEDGTADLDPAAPTETPDIEGDADIEDNK